MSLLTQWRALSENLETQEVIVKNIKIDFFK